MTTDPQETTINQLKHRRSRSNLRPDSAAKGRETQARLRKLRAGDKLIYSPMRQTVGDQRNASAELLPRILGDELAWRGSLLDLVAEMRAVLLGDIRERIYEPKATLPALVREVRGLLELEMKVIDSAKGLPFLKDAQSKQVSAIYSRFELTRQHLIKRGIMRPDGTLIPRPGGVAPASAPAEDARAAEPPALPAAPPPPGEGVS